MHHSGDALHDPFPPLLQQMWWLPPCKAQPMFFPHVIVFTSLDREVTGEGSLFRDLRTGSRHDFERSALSLRGWLPSSRSRKLPWTPRDELAWTLDNGFSLEEGFPPKTRSGFQMFSGSMWVTTWQCIGMHL